MISRYLHKYGVSVNSPLYDTMIAHYLLRPDALHNMDIFSEGFLQYKPIPIKDLIEEKRKKSAQHAQHRAEQTDRIRRRRF